MLIISERFTGFEKLSDEMREIAEMLKLNVVSDLGSGDECFYIRFCALSVVARGVCAIC